MTNHDEDTESIASLESESEDETKIEPIRLKSKQTPISKYKQEEIKPLQEVEISKKTGKPKRIMSEAQKKVLASARVKARAVRKELKEVRDAEKNIKKESLLMRKLQVEAKVLEHNENKKKLFVQAGYIESEALDAEIKKKKKAPAGEKDRLENEIEEDKIRQLEEQLANLRSSKKEPALKTTLFLKGRTPKTNKNRGRGDTTPVESPEESEDEPEPEPEPKIKRKEVLKPKMEINPKRLENQNPMSRVQARPDMSKEMREAMMSLFPNYTG